MANYLNRCIFSNSFLLKIILTVLVTSSLILLIILGISPIHKNSTFFGSFLSTLKVAYADETFEIDSNNKVDSGTQNEKRVSDLRDEIDEKSKPNQNHNDGQTIGEDFNNLKLTLEKSYDNSGDFKKENLVKRHHDKNNINKNNKNKDSQTALPAQENKIHESIQVCDTSSSSGTISRSCSEDRYCKSVSYSKVNWCIPIDNHVSNNPLQADAGSDQVVRPGQTVILNDNEKLRIDSVGLGDDYTISWAQLFPMRPVIKLSDKYAASPTFEAPITSHDTVFIFQLTIKSEQFEDEDIVKVMVTKSDETSSYTADSPSKTQITSNLQHEIRVEQVDDERPDNKIVIGQEKTSVNVQKNNDSDGLIIGKDKLDEVENDAYNSKNDDSVSMSCSADRIIIVKSTQGLINCSIHNESSFPIELQLKCSGLEGTGVQCFINRYYRSGSIVVEGMSTKTFPVVAISPFIHSGEMELYPFTISAN